MTAAELANLPDDGYLYELVEGRLVRMPPPKSRHGWITWDLSFVLGKFVEAQQLGRIFASETGFLVSQPGEPDTVLGGDVAFVQRGRLPPPTSPEWEEYFRLAPDLVAEVASSSQFRPEMGAKACTWLAGGTHLVWIVWPKARSVDVWQRTGDAIPMEPMTTLHEGDDLDGLDVVPGFRYPVAELLA